MKKNILKRIFALVLAMVMALGLTGCASPEGQYNAANKLLIKGEYEKAAEKFEALGSFNDAPQMTRYCRAMAAGENGQYESAVKTFESMGDFKDCPSLVTYYTARYYESEGGKETDHVKWYNAEGWVYYEKAFALYDTLPMFRDSDTRAEACRKAVYDRGVALADGGNYEQAANLMEMMCMEYDEYPDSGEKSQYYAGCYEMQEGNYDLAYGYFIGLEDYMDAPTRAQEALNAMYAKGEECYAEGLYTDAYVYFGWLAEYTEYSSEKGAPADRAKESVYLYGEQMLNAETPNYSEARDAFEIAGNYAPEGKAAGTERVKECWYLEGESLLGAEEPDYDGARAAFENVAEYAPEGKATGTERIKESGYLEGESLLGAEEPDYAGARVAFEIAGEYAPEGKATGTERIKESWYLEGESLLMADEPNYEGAKNAFEKAGDYQDADTHFYELCYLKGEELLTKEVPDFSGARTAFSNAGDYAPEGKASPEEREKEAWYLEGESLIAAEEPMYLQAKSAFENAGEYKDADTRFYELCYLKGEELQNAEKPDYYGAINAYVFAGEYKDSTQKIETCKLNLLKTASPGDLIYFGKYEQDNNLGNGKELIEWIVLEKNGDRLLVLSLYGLVSKEFDQNASWSYAGETTWLSSSLRYWLNNSFIDGAFSQEESNMIPVESIKTLRRASNGIKDHYDYSDDQVFLLTVEEVEKYFLNKKARGCYGTVFANQGKYGDWWTRSTAYNLTDKITIWKDDEGLASVGQESLVRPAIWIDLNP